MDSDAEGSNSGSGDKGSDVKRKSDDDPAGLFGDSRTKVDAEWPVSLFVMNWIDFCMPCMHLVYVDIAAV